MIMPAIDIYLYYKVGLYADFGMAIYYFCAAAYGWFAWSVRRGATKAQVLPITYLPKRVAAYSLADLGRAVLYIVRLDQFYRSLPR